MPRLAFEEPKGRPGPKHHRRENGKHPRDRVVFLLKTATFAVAAILIGAVVLLLATGNGTKDVADTSPAVPEIDAPGSGSRDDSPTTTSTSPVLAPPIVGSQTAQFVPAVPPTTTTPTPPAPAPTTPSDDGPEFAVIGEPCERPGAFSFTAEYEPVMCSNDRPSGPLTWHRMF